MNSTKEKVTLTHLNLDDIGDKFSFSEFENLMLELKYPIIPKELVGTILERLYKYYEEEFDAIQNKVDQRFLEIKMSKFLDRLELGSTALGGFSLVHGDMFSTAYDTICSLMHDKIEELLILLNQSFTNEHFVDWNENRQTKENKPEYDQNNQVLLAMMLKEQGVYLKDIEVGDISKGWYMLTGYKINHFTNMQGENQKDKLYRVENVAKVQRLVDQIQNRLNKIRNEYES